jgi:hypothetical protein
MANKNFQNYAVAGNNVALTYDNVGDTVTIDVNVDKNDVGLGNVDNTSDINKPISTLVQNALNLKEGTITAGTTAQYYRGDKTFQTLDKTAVGLSNVDNTTDLLKPISTATQTALNGKQNLATNLTSISALTFASTSFVKMSAAGTFALDTNTYLTAEADTLASVTGRGNTTSTTLIYSGTTESMRPNVDSIGTIGALNFRFGTAYIRGLNSGANSLDILGTNINLNDSSGNIKLKVFGSTGSVVIQSGGTFTDSGFRLDVNGTARIQNQLTTTGSITAASAIARGVYMNQTLVAAANGDTLVGLDINPTFTVGSFTGTTSAALRVAGNIIPSVTNTHSIGTSGLRFKDVWLQGSMISINSYMNFLYFGATDLSIINASSVQLAKLFGTGNLTLQNGGTFTDAGFRLDVNGTARVQGNITQTSGSYFYNAGNSVNLRSNLAGGSGYVVDAESFNNLTGPNTEQGLADFSGTYAPTSATGSPSFNALKLNFTINQTGGANGITRGLYINPTLTAAADFRAIEVASGITILGASTTAKASLRIPSGTAPTSPVDGDIWYDGTDIKMRIGAVTKTFTLI